MNTESKHYRDYYNHVCGVDTKEGIGKIYDIISDISNRSGLSDVWSSLDGEIQDEIIDKWYAIISEPILNISTEPIPIKNKNKKIIVIDKISEMEEDLLHTICHELEIHADEICMNDIINGIYECSEYPKEKYEDGYLIKKYKWKINNTYTLIVEGKSLLKDMCVCEQELDEEIVVEITKN